VPELFFLILAHPYKNVKNTGTLYVRLMKQTAFLKDGEYKPCLNYSVPIFVDYVCTKCNV